MAIKIKALADRFGSNRMNAEKPGTLLRGCTCVAVPFAGGMCEIPYFTANIVLVNDLDRHAINLGRVVRDHWQKLQERLDATTFDGDTLAEAQDFCKLREAGEELKLFDHQIGKVGKIVDERERFDWACHYFVASWMTRGGSGGTEGEFDQAMSIRWKSTGGDSVVRFRNATEALKEWQKVMRRCTFTTLDAFDFLAECKGRDIPENGIYVDAPWPDDGDKYTHKFTEQMQRDLAARLGEFEQTRIVVRYGDHPLIRELYREPRWTWNLLTGRTQSNGAKAEVLLTNWRP